MTTYSMWTWATLAMVVALCVFELDEAPRAPSVIHYYALGDGDLGDAKTWTEIVSYTDLSYGVTVARPNPAMLDEDHWRTSYDAP